MTTARRATALLRHVARIAMACVTVFAGAPVSAVEAPPRIPAVAVDLHATVPRFPVTPAVADSRGLKSTDLPGAGLGGQLALHVYPVKWRAITLGLGGEIVVARASHTPETTGTTPQTAATVTQTFRTLGAQLSLNFGTGNGWSYLSGGIGRSNMSIVPEDREPLDSDNEVLKTINYGGGARWFAKPHLAFSFDVRFYALNPGTGSFGFPGSPRQTFMSIGAGVSLKP